jgi:hypothetical protein
VTHEEAIDENARVAENAVELERYVSPAIRFCDVELPPVPAHAIFGERATEGFVTVTVATFCVERKLDRPVVGQIDFAKTSVVEVWIGRSVSEPGLAR